jgi:hypothetical protein
MSPNEENMLIWLKIRHPEQNIMRGPFVNIDTEKGLLRTTLWSAGFPKEMIESLILSIFSCKTEDFNITGCDNLSLSLHRKLEFNKNVAGAIKAALIEPHQECKLYTVLYPDVSMPPDCIKHSRSASANVFSLTSSSGKHAYFGAEPVATFLSQRVVEGSLKDHSGRLSR